MKKSIKNNTVKKHTRTLKGMLRIYGMGSFLSIYWGFLCGAAWIPDSGVLEFIDNFYEFIFVQHHFIVGVTKVTPAFVVAYWITFSLAFIMIVTKFEHPYAGQEYGIAKWGTAKEFTKIFANHDSKNEIEVVTGDVVLDKKVIVNCRNYC